MLFVWIPKNEFTLTICRLSCRFVSSVRQR